MNETNSYPHRRAICQSCPTLCDPMDYSPPSSSIHRTHQARILEWGAIPPPGDLPNPAIKPASPAVAASQSVSQFHCPVMSDSLTPWTAARQTSLSITLWSLLKFLSVKAVMPSNHLIFCHPLLLLLSIFPSIRVLSNESVLCIRWPKYWSFSFSISPSNEYSGLISFRTDWLDLLAIQGTLKSLLQHHSSKASVLWCSAFFIVQLSHPYMTTGKTIALTRQSFVGKVKSLLLLMSKHINAV